jgi:cyclase
MGGRARQVLTPSLKCSEWGTIRAPIREEPFSMKSRAGLIVVLCVVLFGSYVYAQFGEKPAELSTIKVRDDLFVVYNDLVPGNTTVLVTNQGLILVDNKFEIDFDNLMAQIRKISNQPIRYVINTHYHGDHSGGNPKMQAQNVQVVASERARPK